MKPVVPVAAALALVGAFAHRRLRAVADRQIKYRQAIMTAQGYHFYGILGSMAKGSRPYDKEQAMRARSSSTS